MTNFQFSIFNFQKPFPSSSLVKGKRSVQEWVQRGFTLIELLTVVAIIGILATLLMANFVGVRQRARDAQRKSDLRQIQSALELYRADQGSYPTTDTTYYLNSAPCPASSPLTNATGTITYIQTIPCDPAGVTGYNSGNYYYYGTDTAYTLAACLENGSDSQITSAPSPNNSSCSNNNYFVLKNP